MKRQSFTGGGKGGYRKNKHCKSTPFEELYMKDKAWNTSLHLYACVDIYRWIDYSPRLKIRLWLPRLLTRWYYLCLDKLFALIRWGNWIIRSKIYVWENNALERTLFWEETCYSLLSGKVIWFARMGTKRKILALGERKRIKSTTVNGKRSGPDTLVRTKTYIIILKQDFQASWSSPSLALLQS